MPSRKLTDRCTVCGTKNHLRSKFCNECGGGLDPNRAGKDDRGRAKLHTDIAHPINSRTRQRVEQRILDEYDKEINRSREPDYRPTLLGADYDEPNPLSRRQQTPEPEKGKEGGAGG